MHVLPAVSLLLVLAISSLPVLAQDSSEDDRNSWSSITLYPDAPESAFEKSREAKRLSIQAQCQVFQAMWGFNEASNGDIAAASASFLDAGGFFVGVAEIVSDDVALAPPEDNEEVQAAYRDIEMQGYDRPASYKAAFEILSKASEKAGFSLSDVKYSGFRAPNLKVLRRLQFVSGEAAQMFVAISTLTGLSNTQ